MAEVQLLGVSKTFPGGVKSVDAIDLTIADGEFLTLVGPSGCGKSTTLNLIAGLERLSAGAIFINGKNVSRDSPGERDVAMVFQSYGLYPHFTVERNLSFPLEVQGETKRVRDQRVFETARRLEIDSLLHRKPSELSGGQRQRVALGRALVRRPKVFLFDEPLSNLDAALRTQVRAELKKLHEELKSTFIYVTHDQVEAMTLSDRIAVMHQGKLQQIGTPREVFDQPENRFVAGLFGSPAMGFLDLAFQDCVLGIRPEHVKLSREEVPHSLRGTVYLSEPAGSETWITVDLHGQRLVASSKSKEEIPSGTVVWIQFETDHIHRFDRQTGQRVL